MKIVAATVFSLLTLAAIPFLRAEEPPLELQGALWLRGEMRYEEARQALTNWVAKHPDDGRAHYEYGYTLMLQATAESDATRATALRKEAYALATKAKTLGYDNAVLDLVLQATDANGTDLRDPKAFSAKPEAAELIKQGEQAFSSGKMEEALAFYQKAYALDPHSYSAALFTGDVYFTQKKYAAAIEWFDKAIATSPNRETAYRYAADALVKLNRPREALDRYIDAVVAEPYNRIPREMLQRVRGATLRTPAYALPQVTVTLENGAPKITLPPPDKSTPTLTAALLAYAAARGTWLKDERQKYFPADAPPRHSLAEEVYGLRFLADYFGSISAKDAKGSEAISTTIATIKSLDQEGLLESFLLLDRPDNGLAEDYATYRLAHRSDLVRYISTVWIAAEEKKTSR